MIGRYFGGLKVCIHVLFFLEGIFGKHFLWRSINFWGIQNYLKTDVVLCEYTSHVFLPSTTKHVFGLLNIWWELMFWPGTFLAFVESLRGLFKFWFLTRPSDSSVPLSPTTLFNTRIHTYCTQQNAKGGLILPLRLKDEQENYESYNFVSWRGNFQIS